MSNGNSSERLKASVFGWGLGGAVAGICIGVWLAGTEFGVGELGKGGTPMLLNDESQSDWFADDIDLMLGEVADYSGNGQ